jgi:hypothetical protein
MRWCDWALLPIPRPSRAYRDLTQRFGIPDATRTSHPDARIIALGRIGPVAVSGAHSGRCLPLEESLLLQPTSEIRLRAPDRGVDVQLRRFGSAWVTVGRVASDTTRVIALPGLASPKPWVLHAPGACEVRDAPVATIVEPQRNAVLTATVTLVATIRIVQATRVEFRLSGEGLDDVLLGTGTLGYAWALRWDTTSVPNGSYALSSVAIDSAGKADVSEAVPISVAN